MASFYLTDGQRQQGPYTAEQLAMTGLAADALVWADGWPEWKRADTVPSLFGAIRRPAPPQSPAQSERVWSVHDQGRQLGPHTLLELAQLVAVGTVSPAAMAWKSGSPEWVPVSTLVPTPMFHAAPALASPHPASSHPDSSNRMTAGICGILLGGLGIHKFILGFPVAGAIMLGVTLLSFGFGWFVMGVIGIIEGIIYLTKTDQEFHLTYVVHKRQWF